MSSKGSSFELQKNIKDNSQELQNFVADLHQWEKEFDNEKQSSKPRKNISKDLPPVRCREPDVTTETIVTKKTKQRISSYDYDAWDKFNVDKALNSSSSEEEEEDLSPQAAHQMQTSHSGSKASGFDKKEKAIKLKDEGNKFYSSGRLEDAVAKYTQGMALDPTNPILPANRAMALIKLEKYEAAESDCNRCIKLDATYIKAYLRRGSSRIKLQKMKLAAEDFRKVLELEPWNKDAKKELEKLESPVQDQSNKMTSKDSKNQGNMKKVASDQLKEVSTKISGESRPEVNSFDKLSHSEDKPTSTVVNKYSEKKQGKKIKILEVDSSQGELKIPDEEGSEIVTPVVKPPHERSQKPLKNIQVFEVPSEELIPKEILSSVISKDADNVKSIPPVEIPTPTTSPNKTAKLPQEKKEKSTDKPTKIVSLPSTLPRTSHQFTQDWQMLAPNKSLAAQYLQKIPTTFFEHVDLESDVLVSLISSFGWDDFSPEQAVSYLSALVKSDGFNVKLMFLDSEQKKGIYGVVEKCRCLQKSHGDLLATLEGSLV